MNVFSAAHYLSEATLTPIAGLLFPCFFSKKQRCSCHDREVRTHEQRLSSGFIKARESHRQEGRTGAQTREDEERKKERKKERRKRNREQRDEQRRL
jgi:hypothetical protein